MIKRMVARTGKSPEDIVLWYNRPNKMLEIDGINRYIADVRPVGADTYRTSRS